MATINGFLLNNSVMPISINTNTSLNNQSYTGFTFSGNCILDSVAIQNYIKSDAQILATSVSTLPDWTPDMLFLAKFDNTTDGSNVFGMIDAITSWSLYRRKISDSVMVKIVEVDKNIMSWMDYSTMGNETYEYLIFANSGTQVSEPIITDEILTSYFGYYLIDGASDFVTSADPNNSTPLIANGIDADLNSNIITYKFDVNVEADKIMQNNDVTFLKSYNIWDTCVIGNRNFRSGSFTTTVIPYDEYGNYDYLGEQRWADYFDDLRTFLHNKQGKYYKNYQGDLMYVVTEGNGSTSDTKHARGISVGQKFGKNNQQADMTIYYTEIKNPFTNN